MSRNVFLVLSALVIFVLVHFPFLDADPDHGIVYGRGPFTDEGLYLSQVRNSINTGQFDFNESDCFFKAPVFSAVNYPFLSMLGIHRITARMVTLLFSIITLIVLLLQKREKLFWILLLLLCHSQYYFFHYAHYAQAEAMQCNCILLSLLFYKKSFTAAGNRASGKAVFLSCLFLALAYSIKLNLLYLAPLLPLAFFFAWMSSVFSREAVEQKKRVHNLLIAALCTAFFFAVYWIIWIVPHQDYYSAFIKYVTASDPGFKFSWTDFNTVSGINWRNYAEDPFFSSYSLLLKAGMLVLVIMAAINRIKKIKSLHQPVAGFAIAFFLLEFHKLGLHYLPARYILPSALLAAVIGATLVCMMAEWNRLLLVPALLAAGCIFYSNAVFISDSFTGRRYALTNFNSWMSQHDLRGKTIIGTWAPSVTWESKARVIPVWNDYFYHHDLMNRFNPDLIIAENNESDSDSAYIKKGIDLKSISDSIEPFEVFLWKPVVYWLKPNGRRK